MPPVNITLSILESYYPNVATLATYLSEILASADDAGFYPVIRQDSDSDEFQQFLDKSFVASALEDYAQPGKGASRIEIHEPMVVMREIIDRAQQRILSKSKNRMPNVITAGYSSKPHNGQGKIGTTRLGIFNEFVNTTVTVLQGACWERLLKRIGEDAMFHLLAETSVYVSLPNECLCQMTGRPIVELKLPTMNFKMGVDERMKRKPEEQADSAKPRKRARTITTAPSKDVSTAKRSPADVVFHHSRLCYARPVYIPQSDILATGLPPNHILNRINPSYGVKKKGVFKEPDTRKQMEDARHLAKYVFPRQYGLSHPFALPVHMYRLPDYADREDEIKAKGACKTPKRVKSALDLVEKMIWRHSKCSYKALRDIACPSKLKHDDQSQPLDSSVILELMSEQSICLHTQQSLNTSGISVVPSLGLTQLAAQTQSKPRFAEFTCSDVEVYRYVVLVTKAVIPQKLWGSHENFRSVMKAVRDYVSYRRYESISLHRLMQGLETSSSNWLAPGGSATANDQGHVPVSDSLKRRELLEEFIFWYFGSFLSPLLRTTFYVTESSAFRNRILYFRQDDWNVLCAPLIERLSSETFSKLENSEAEEILRQRTLGFSFVRLLPKDTGVRPIVNLRRKKVDQKGLRSGGQQSINDILQAAFQILTYEKNARPELIGASVFGHNEIYVQLKSYRRRLESLKPSALLPKLYFVKVDVQACFDTIEQSKLLHILKGVLSEDSYVLPRFGQVTQTAGKVNRKWVKKALPDGEHPHFLRYATQLAGMLRHTIFVDQVRYPSSTKEEVLELLEEHITENIVKIGQDYYRQIVGIPQGSVLSSMLCSIFYADLERNHLQFSQDPQSLLLRLIDDYLLITTDKAKARKFLDVMIQGHPEYGCFISQEKTLTNFDYDAQIMKVTAVDQKAFPWCALFIDMSDLSVSTDYTRYNDKFIIDSLTVERGKRAGIAFLHKMLQLGRAKSHVIFTDSELNSTTGVYLNIYQNFILVAMRMHHYLKSWGLNIGKNCSFVQRTVQQVIRYTYAVVRSKSTNKIATTHWAECKIQKPSVLWLGTKAFHTVLSQKPTAYKPLLKSLAFELSLGKNRRYRKEFRQIVRQGVEVMVHLAF